MLVHQRVTPVTPNYVGLPWCVPCVPAMSHGPLWPLWAARFLGQKRHFKTPRRPHKALMNLSRQQFAFIWNHCESLWIISMGNMTINKWNFGAIFSQTRMIASISEIARKRPCFELVNRQSRFRSRSRGKNQITNIKHPHSMVAEMWFRPLHIRWFLKGVLYEQRTKSFVIFKYMFYAMHKLGSSPIAYAWISVFSDFEATHVKQGVSIGSSPVGNFMRFQAVVPVLLSPQKAQKTQGNEFEPSASRWFILR